MSLSSRAWQRLGPLAVCLLALLGGNFAAHGQDPQPRKQTEEASVWMRKKLDYSQNILAGIATADFDQIAKNAEAMRALGKMEAFVRSQTPGYRTQLQIFDEANAEILRQANRDNVDGAALAFTQLTISCVNCHKKLRESKPK